MMEILLNCKLCNSYWCIVINVGLCFRLVSYERLVVEPEPMKVIISSDQLYFFQDSPPSPNYLHTKIDLEELVECRLASSKSSKIIHSIVSS